MRHVIIGTSAAGLKAAETLRAYDPGSAITLISDEAHRPYSRPLLTYLLSREVTMDRLWLREEDFFVKQGFTARLGEKVIRVDPQAHEVQLASGESLPFDRLLIASGARPRLLDLPGADLEGVFTLRNLADWQRLDRGLNGGGPVAVVEAGAVGLKAAEALARRGHYRRLVYRQGRLVGLTFVGAIEDAGLHFQLMARQEPVPAPGPVNPGLMWGDKGVLVR